jgi:uncharacterized membrane protein YhaH (DUF805 family)
MRWYFEVLSRYVMFSGRASRAEYWMFYLFDTLIGIALAFFERWARLAPWFTSLYVLVVILPSCAVAVRRLHDIGRSWKRLFLVLIPVIGAILLIIDFAQAGQPGNNRYGPSPEPAKKFQAPVWSVAFFLSVLSVLTGFNLWLKGSPILGMVFTFGIPGVIVDLLASFENTVKTWLSRRRR